MPKTPSQPKRKKCTCEEDNKLTQAFCMLHGNKALLPKRTKKKENGWFCYEQEFAFRETEMFENTSVIIPVRLFLNIKTGEIKSVAAIGVEKNGTQYYIDLFTLPQGKRT